MIDIFYGNQLVNATPLKCNVFDPSKIKVVPNTLGFVDQALKFEGNTTNQQLFIFDRILNNK